MRPDYIVIHTAAFSGNNCDAQIIDSWHRDRGWTGIGYHFVVLNDRHATKNDGEVEEGRAVDKAGAHALGINSRSLGICCVGHGDLDDFTPAQYASLQTLVPELMARYNVPVERVIGHRELNLLADNGIVEARYRTTKSCPGTKVDMDGLRARLPVPSSPAAGPVPPDPELVAALDVLDRNRNAFPNATDELLEFLTHPEVMVLRT